ncbi:MFS general substrate transporter [Glarea lozoyensis ATCC 20868]|uniref:MFS general substrate transporter n=1 Tax=Glarea lozoyensis (strain ATCC 20868 / MF5171) TaxID=1116229 RepID=S3CM64_GLAL2|nr:MFS general substrate transporter [Glarea lozoyensis ATCC 20868]EPE26279.1 MFS general substrate transporter [Glarea lozoyensis ATCC 20868]
MAPALSKNSSSSHDLKDGPEIEVKNATASNPEMVSKSSNSELNTEQQQVEEIEYVSGYKLAVIVACVALSCFLMLLDTMIVSTCGTTAPNWTNIYPLQHKGWTFLAFFGIFEVGSVLCGAAVDSTMLIVGRAIAGFGAAGIIIGAITIISGCVPFEKRPALIGMTMGFNQLGLVAGPIIGGAFTSYSDWRWCFYVNLPVGALAAVAIVFLRIPEQTIKPNAFTVLAKLHHYLDLVGFALFAPAVLQLLLALQYGGNAYPWGSSRVIGLFCGSAATFGVWLLWNFHKGDDALLPRSMIRRTAVWASGAYQAFLMSAVYGGIYFLPIYFQAINDASPMLSGVYLLPTILPQLFMAASSGAIITKMGYVIPLAVFSTVFLSIGSGLYSVLQPGSSTVQWAGFQVIGGIGSGAGLQVAIIAIQAVVTGDELSSAMAFLVFAQSLGPAIALTLYNVIFSETLKAQLAERAPNLSAQAIIDAGATGFHAIVSKQDLPTVLIAYSNSIDRVFYLVAALAATCSVFVWEMGWHDVRKKEELNRNNNYVIRGKREETV